MTVAYRPVVIRLFNVNLRYFAAKDNRFSTKFYPYKRELILFYFVTHHCLTIIQSVPELADQT
jgi:hypothetical protein